MKNYTAFRCRIWALMLFAVLLITAGCSDSRFDYENPEVKVFVNQLRLGTFKVKTVDGKPVMPNFKIDDIGELLKYSEDLSSIPQFPLAPISYKGGGNLRLGECLLWVVESIRIEHNASLGCKMVHRTADNYEGIFFLNDQEVLDAARHYKTWWKEYKELPMEDVLFFVLESPLDDTPYMWW